MILIDREMKAVAKTTNKSSYSSLCQASINSNGCITLRNYNPDGKDNDEIIILSQKETLAIVKLFKEIKRLENYQDLPF